MTASPDSDSLRTLKAHCRCRSVEFTVTISSSKLPLSAHLCHCSICRYTHGTLCVFHAELPHDIFPQFESSIEHAKGYSFADAKTERFFCRTCGCHIGDKGLSGEDKGQWIVATSVFAQVHTNDFILKTHVNTNSAPGGGVYEWLQEIGDRKMKSWNPEETRGVVEHSAPPPETDEHGNEVLRAKCHCGGVSFTFPRPDAVNLRVDVMGDPYLRAHVLGWTFIPLILCSPRIPTSLEFGTMIKFESSPGVTRTFCGSCGATVFFTCKERQPSETQYVVDIAVGILRAPEGPTAKKWLTWRTGRLSWVEDGKVYDPAFIASLERGFDQWGQNEYGHSPSFEIDG
ncbi:DUF636 domain protein [Myriangium duriaei CBS 260.36]|uniref:DUF636 domain protein n=1 Tax=Myriangium duriaei CBS 260.36 TaxID=1168546 RepID=A0A9P4IX57_9PEZI|nr:DUF636 domain protein [Myriangium duriaei CBS 260.36]